MNEHCLFRSHYYDFSLALNFRFLLSPPFDNFLRYVMGHQGQSFLTQQWSVCHLQTPLSQKKLSWWFSHEDIMCALMLALLGLQPTWALVLSGWSINEWMQQSGRNQRKECGYSSKRLSNYQKGKKELLKKLLTGALSRGCLPRQLHKYPHRVKQLLPC